MEASPRVMEEPIIVVYCRSDDAMHDPPKHPQARLGPSEIVTLAVLFAVKRSRGRAFYRGLIVNWRHLFPNTRERTRRFRLFRLFTTHHDWADRLLAEPTHFGVADTYGIELIHPVRERRSKRQIGRKGLSNKRWIVGGKLGFALISAGRVCAWDGATANTHDKHFRPMIEPFDEKMTVPTDNGFHGVEGDPPNTEVCHPRTWGCRMLVETVLSMLTVVCDIKRVRHRAWDHFRMHVSWIVAAFNLMLDTAAEAGASSPAPLRIANDVV